MGRPLLVVARIRLLGFGDRLKTPSLPAASYANQERLVLIYFRLENVLRLQYQSKPGCIRI